MGCGASRGSSVPASVHSESYTTTASRGKKKTRADRQAERLHRLKHPEQAAALATDLANQIRTEQQQEQTGEATKGGAEVDATLNSMELIEQMMLGVTEKAVAMLGAEKCTLWLVNPRSQAMWSFLADTSLDGSGAAVTEENSKDVKAASRVLHVAVGTGLAGTCAATGEVIEVADAWQDERFDKSHDEKTGYRTKAVACVPIVKAPKRRSRAQRKADRLGGSSFKDAKAKENRIVGVMQVLNRVDGDGPFDSNAVKNLAKLATDAGLVLQATKLYREITGLHESVSSRDGEA